MINLYKGKLASLGSRVECPAGSATLEATQEQQRLIRRLAYWHGRLPRRRKKQVMNRVLRHDIQICKIVSLLMYQMFSDSELLYIMANVMFHDKNVMFHDKVHGYVLAVNEAEYHTVYLCLKRIKKKYRTYIAPLKKAGIS